MEAQPLIARPLRFRRRIDLWRVWDITYPFLIAFYVTAIVVLSISGVRAAAKRHVSDPDHPSTSTAPSSQDIIVHLQEAYQALQCHTQQQTATLLSLSPAGLLGADQVYAGNMMLGLGKLLVGTTALVTWCGFLVIDKRKHPLHAGNLLNSAAVLTLVWLAWGGLDMGLWVVGGVYGVPGCFDA